MNLFPRTWKRRVANSPIVRASYWTEWVRRLSIAYDWQDAIIRAAITLKLSNFEETGGIVAAHDDVHTRGARFGAHLGLPLLLAARRLFRRQGAQSPRRNADDGRLHLLHPGHRFARDRASGLQHCSDRSAWTRKSPPICKAIAATARCASATPPRGRSSTTPMAASSSPRCRCSSTGGCRGRATTVCSTCWSRSASRPQQLAFEPDAGIWEYRGRARVHTYSGGDVLGRRAAGLPPSRSISASMIAPLIGRIARRHSIDDCSTQAWNEKRGAFTAAIGVE